MSLLEPFVDQVATFAMRSVPEKGSAKIEANRQGVWAQAGAQGPGRGNAVGFNLMQVFSRERESEGFLLCTSSAGAQLSFPGRCRRVVVALRSRCRRIENLEKP